MALPDYDTPSAIPMNTLLLVQFEGDSMPRLARWDGEQWVVRRPQVWGPDFLPVPREMVLAWGNTPQEL